MGLNARQYSLFVAFVLAVALTILSWDNWKYFVIIPISVFMWLLTDLMFFGHNTFMYEPNLHYWKEANEEEF